MLWSIPISAESVVTNTPMGARAITHVFFEDKNGGLFERKEDGVDTVSIQIDGKQVLNGVPVLPFCTSAPNKTDRYRWQDVALEVGINVDFSEVRISAGARSNDYNVVFVTSDKEVDALKGFEYVEWRKFSLREVLTVMEAKRRAEVIWERQAKPMVEAYKAKYQELYKRTESRFLKPEDSYHEHYVYENGVARTMTDEEFAEKQAVVRPIVYYSYYKEAADGTSTLVEFKFDPEFILGSGLYTKVRKLGLGNEVSSWDVNKLIFINNAYNRIQMAAYRNFNVDASEHTIALDRAPQKMFVMQLASDVDRVLFADTKLNITLSSGIAEVLPPQTDLTLMSVDNGVPMRQAIVDFEEGTMSKSIMFTPHLNMKEGKDLTESTLPYYTRQFKSLDDWKTWEMYLFFIYRKLI